MGDGPHPGVADARSALIDERERLASEVQRLRGDLGGLVYEMAIRDHFRLDVLVRRAAVLQQREAELAEVERLLRAGEGEIAGNCRSCGALRGRGAVFCWQCGSPLMEQVDSGAIGNGAARS